MTSRTEQNERLTRLRGFLRADPTNRKLLQETIELAIKCAEFDAARTLLDEALTSTPDDVELRFQKGTLALASRRFTEAEEIFDSLLQDNAHPAVIYNLAYARVQSGHFSDAKKALDALTADSWAEIPDAHKLYAHASHHLEDWATGIAHLESFLGQNKGDAEAWGLLAMLTLDAGQSDKVSKAAEQALALQPEEPNALVALGSLALERQEADEAIEFFAPLLSRHPEHGRAWSGMAFAKMLKMDLPGAWDAFEHATRFMPNHIGTWHGLAWLQILKNDLSGAGKSLDKAMAIDRNFGETHGGLAVVAVLQGRTAEAEPMIRRALGLNRESFAGRFAQSLLLARRGDQKQSSELVKNILSSKATGGPSLQGVIAKVLERQVREGSKGQTVQ